MNVNDQPKITVGTVCYNAVSCIENLIKSVSTNSLSDISKARNNFAHGNLDKDFVGLSLLDLIFLEIVLYAMQLKYYGLEDINIKKAVNELFHKNLVIKE